jgi:tetratricopeptide (TPR) repeat protein
MQRHLWNDAWALVDSGRYADALTAFDRLLANEPEEVPLLKNRAIVLLCLGRLGDALAGLQKVDGLNRKHRKRSAATLDWIAAVQWLLGDRDGAVATNEQTIRGIFDRSIHWVDFSKGMRSALLCWYFGVSLSRLDILDKADTCIRRLRERWPESDDSLFRLAISVLGETSFDRAAPRFFAKGDLKELRAKTHQDVLARRDLVQALFYLAVSERSRGNEALCLERMRECFEVKNPHIEIEWYLGRGEIERRRKPG